MNVRTAVEKRDTAVAEAPVKEPLHVLARKAIERQAVVLQQILPQHMSLERFEQVALAQVKGTPKLLRCFETIEGQTSLLYSVVQAAAAGLELGSVAQQAWLIPFEARFVAGKDGRGQEIWATRMECRLQVGDRGVRALSRRDPAVKELVADVVREGDHFVYRRTLDGDIFEHEAVGPSTRELTHAYCLIRWVEGGARVIVLDRDEVLGIRDRYSEGWKAELGKPAEKRKNPWSTREWTMWVKTAIHQARREINISPEVAAVLASDADGNTVLPQLTETAAMAELATPAYVPNGVDPETGEVSELDYELAASEIEAKIEYAADLTVTDLIDAGINSGQIDGTSGLGAQRKRLMALAAELIGVAVTDPAELLVDQAVAEELLAKLTARAAE